MEMFLYKILLKDKKHLISFKKESKEYFKEFDNDEISMYYDRLIEKSDNLEEVQNIIRIKKINFISLKKVENRQRFKEITNHYLQKIEHQKKSINFIKEEYNICMNNDL
jgi:hypothetical protein